MLQLACEHLDVELKVELGYWVTGFSFPVRTIGNQAEGVMGWGWGDASCSACGPHPSLVTHRVPDNQLCFPDSLSLFPIMSPNMVYLIKWRKDFHSGNLASTDVFYLHSGKFRVSMNCNSSAGLTSQHSPAAELSEARHGLRDTAQQEPPDSPLNLSGILKATLL